MEYAVIDINGRQVIVREGQKVEVDKLDMAEGKSVFFKVLLIKNGQEFIIGNPYVKDVSVQCRVIGHFRGKKIKVAKFRSKSRYRKVKGARAEFTSLQVEKIK